MGEFWAKLFSTDGFYPRRHCGPGWEGNDGLVWLHVGSDLFIWLAYLSIPLVLVFLVRRRGAVPFPGLVALAAAFILCCGFTHFLDASMFTTPVYRLAGLLKLATAVVSWGMVFALVPAVPRITAFLEAAGGASASATAEHRPLAAPQAGGWARGYIIALLAAALALLVRAALDRFLLTDHAFVLSLLAVVYVAWQCGFGPAVAALFVSMTGTVYFFVEPVRSFVVVKPSDQMAVAAFFFCGVACAALGGSNREAQRRVRAALAVSQAQRADLEAEVARRRAVEAELREREADLRATAGTLKAFYDSAPLAMGVVEPTDDADLLHVYDNRASCAFFGVGPDQTAGRTATALGATAETVGRWRERYRQAADRGGPVGFDHRYEAGGRAGWLSVTVSPLGPGPAGRPRYCYVAEDVTDRKEAQAVLERAVAERTADLSREREFLRAVLENVEDAVVACDAAGRLTLFNRATVALHGLPADPVPAENWADYYDLFHPDGATRMAPAEVPLFRALAGEHVRGAEMVVAPAGGRARALVASGQPLIDDAGNRLGAVVSMHDVTDRLAAEEARAEVIRQQAARAAAERSGAELRASEERFRTLADNISQFAWTTDPDGWIYWYNRRWFEYTGTTLEDMRGWGWKAVHHPAHVDRVVEKFARHIQAGEAWEDTFPLRRADGEYRWFLSRARPVRDESGAVTGWFGTNTDIEDQRQAEAAVRASEARFRALAETVPQIVWVTRPDGFHEYYNRRWYEFTGVPPGSTDGEGWNGLFHPDDQDRAWETWRRSLATGEKYEIEYRLRRHDGQYRWMLGLAEPQRDDAGTILKWFGTCTDIDDARRLVEEAARNAERFRTLTEAIPQMVWNADPAGKVTYFNRRWEEFTGTTVATAGAAAGLIHPDDAAGLDATWKAAVARGAGPYAREFRLRRAADGAYRWVLSTAVTLPGPDGAAAEWVGTLTDIHHQKAEAEYLDWLVQERTAALTATARELQRSNGELEQFAYVASHDLQEPLRKIQAFGNLLQKKCAADLPEVGREYVQKMHGSAGRMSQLIDDLLRFSRVTTHAKPFTRNDLGAVLADVLDDLELRLEQTGGTVEAGPLPAIDADPTQMRQLLQNLVGNALKFARPGVPPVVTVRAEPATLTGDDGRPRAAVRLTVADNGIGFEDRHKDRIFQVFQRLHGRDEYEGTGVGLAVCKKIVDRHGGTIAAVGRVGEGATFVVVLPVAQPTPGATPPPAPA